MLSFFARPWLRMLALPVIICCFVSGKKKTVAPVYRLSYASFAPLNEDIFIASADGSGARPLAPSPANDFNATFSPDGQWVVFTSNRNGPYNLYRVHPDGRGLQQLTHENAFDDQAAFSPDGKKIAFVSTRSGQADIYVLDLATLKAVNLTHHPGGDFRPCWSPDGQWIAFSSDRTSKAPRPVFTILQSTEIYTMRSDGTEQTRRTWLDAVTGSPCWSPDGKQLLFYQANFSQARNMNTVERAPSTTQLVAVTLAGNSLQNITRDTGEKIYPHWFADGRIAYVTWQNNGAIRFLNSSQSVKGAFNHPSWSPDGKQLVYDRETAHEWPPLAASYSHDKQFELVRCGIFASFSPSGKLLCNDKTAGIHHNQIMEMNADGSHRFILFGDSVKSALAPVWSPDGSQIAFGFGRFFQSLKGPAVGDIAIIDRDGSHLQVLTNGKGNFGFPSWSPDGKKLVFRGATDSLMGLFIIDIATKQVTRLTADSRDNFPCWSPDGSRISFTSKRFDNYDIFTIQPDGTGLKRLTDDPGNDAHCTWSPDGQWIAFSSGRTGFKDESALHPYNPQPYGEICVMRADGSDVRILTNNAFEEATPAWIPGNR